MRFQDAARDARAVVYQAIQNEPLVARAADALAHASAAERVMARAVMNGQTLQPDGWRATFPTLFAWAQPADREHAEAILAMALEVAARGDAVRDQVRGAIVEALTERLLARRVGEAGVHRERRILFDGVPAEIHPYDVTVELPGWSEAWDCKWGARGIGDDVLHQLDDARRHAEAEGGRLLAGLVIFDARRSCEVRLARRTSSVTGVRLVSLETLDALGRRKAAG